MKKSYQNAYENLLKSNKFLNMIVTKAFKKEELTYPQYLTLKILFDVYPKGCNAAYIKSHSTSNYPDITRLLDKLEIKGLIIRELNRESRREIKITITPLGINTIKNLMPVEDSMKDFLTKLNEEEIEQLNEVMTKLISV